MSTKWTLLLISLIISNQYHCRLDTMFSDLFTTIKCFGTCSKDYEPVCGANKEKKNLTYRNICELKCKYKHKLVHKGVCKPIVCDKVKKPKKGNMCGVDGKTYDSKYALHCASMMLDYEGKCKKKLREAKTGIF